MLEWYEFLLIGVILAAAGGVIGAGIEWALTSWLDWREQQRQEHLAQLEATLDRKQSELRRAILDLAEALADERLQANQASAEMIRAAYVSRGQLPQG